MKLINPGDIIRTPRFLNVKIEEVFESPEKARAAGYTEPTHFADEHYEVLGKSLDMYHMAFAAAFRPGVELIQPAEFVSIWDGGFDVQTKCKVNLLTREVFEIQKVDVRDEVITLDEEYILWNGERFPVYQKDEVEDSKSFWYN